ncbi:hypothetical protein CGGC5_v003621 [Colletotrichum fructicola Nara gc5]|uniref:Uncharacterized protein n=1 Tax=Colletotrichum fructicola (strain Nara gc5) TaxID=1213859 RepID=A0A7J6JGD2_COLFN|nr:hypothetical protein CGGC5_v003621 [Colletotrichum fructicola Nara gc5]
MAPIRRCQTWPFPLSCIAQDALALEVDDVAVVPRCIVPRIGAPVKSLHPCKAPNESAWDLWMPSNVPQGIPGMYLSETLPAGVEDVSDVICCLFRK